MPQQIPSLSAEQWLRFFEVEDAQRRDGSGVFILGCVDHVRYTVLSQQYRAIRLIYSLAKVGRLRPGDTVGIVGGGVAGTTAACYAAADCGADVQVIERRGDVLELFAQAKHRWLHPGLFDWPRRRSSLEVANLRYMSWSFARASDVALTLKQHFKAIQSRADVKLTVVPNLAALTLSKSPTAGFIDKKGLEHKYRHLILAVGPGAESKYGNSQTYWEPDSLAAEQDPSGITYIIGVGDGGIIDSLRVRLRDFDEKAVVDDFFKQWNPIERQRVEAEILDFETAYRNHDHSPAQIAEFYTGITHSAPQARDWLRDRLRTSTTLCLIDRYHVPYTTLASPLNRFFLGLLQSADDSFQYISGDIGNLSSMHTDRFIALKDRDPLAIGSNDRIVCRVGPDSALKLIDPAGYQLARTALSVTSKLDIFGLDVLDDTALYTSLRAPRPTSSRWSESAYPSENILTTRYGRYDDEGHIIAEHAQRGREHDIGARYLDRRSITALDAIATNQRVLLIGDFGSGKSHILSRLQTDAEAVYGRSEGPSLVDRIGWRHTSCPRPFPVRISAQLFAIWLLDREPSSDALWEYVTHTRGIELTKTLLDKGRQDGLLLMIEHWSDVPSTQSLVSALRQVVASSLETALGYLADHAISYVVIITSLLEPIEYVDSTRSVAELELFRSFERFVLAPLTSIQQRRLVASYCEESRLSAQSFPGPLADGDKARLEALISTPAGLRQMLDLWSASHCTLPSSIGITLLYKRFLEEYFNTSLDTTTSDSLSPDLAEAVLRLRQIVTVRYHKNPATAPIVFLETDLAGHERVRDLMVASNHLMLHKEGLSIASGFIQDLLVGWGLASGDVAGGRREHTTAFEAIQLTVERVSFIDLDRRSIPRIAPIRFAVQWCLDTSPAPNVAHILLNYLFDSYNTDLHIAAARVLAESSVTLDLTASRYLQDRAKRWSDTLVRDIADAAPRMLSPRERRILGRAISILGDPRPGVSVGENGLPDISWVTIGTGSTKCGATDVDERAYIDRGEPMPNDEDCRNVTFDSFELSRYPVTRAQFKLFMDDTTSGYSASRCWSGLKRPDRTEAFAEHADDNCPMTAVTWDEAMAFATWLADFTGDDITLPTAYEWEHAGRQTDERAMYSSADSLPYGSANCQEEGLPGAIAVGLFPESNASNGLADMCGNVFEWCRDEYDDRDPDYKLTKGGSYNHDRLRCRLAVRGKKHRTSQHPYIGFRLARRRRSKTVRDRVAIVGSGFAGICTAVRLIAIADRPIEVVIIERERRQLFGGIAYQAPATIRNWEHLFNLQAARISMFREDRDDFLSWLNSKSTNREDWPDPFKGRKFGASSEVPRRLYQSYLRDRLVYSHSQAHCDVRVRVVVGEVTDVIDDDRRLVVESMDRRWPLECSQAVLCTGNLLTNLPAVITPDVAESPRYINDQFVSAAQAALAEVNDGDRVLVLGTQLRAFDVVMTLASELSNRKRRNVRITLVSRHGHTHPPYSPAHRHEVLQLQKPAFVEEDAKLERDLEQEIIEEYDRVYRGPASGVPENVRSERILKAWERYIPKLIQRLPSEVVIDLMEKWRSLITTLRIGVVPAIRDVVDSEIRAGNVSIKRAEIRTITPSVDGLAFRVMYAGESGAATFEYIVNCTGRDRSYAMPADALWRSLRVSGLVRPHWTNIGVDVDSFGMLIGERAKPSSWIAAVGVMREGDEFARHGRLGSFSFTIGPIKNQAFECAVYCLRRLTAPSMQFRERSMGDVLNGLSGNFRHSWTTEDVTVIVKAAIEAAADDESIGELDSVQQNGIVKWILSREKLGHRILESCLAAMTCRDRDAREKAQAERTRVRQELAEGVSDRLGMNHALTDRVVFAFVRAVEDIMLAHLTRLDVVEPD